MEPLLAISPIDGRYHGTTEVLQPFSSEYALIKNRIRVMVDYLIYLTDPSRGLVRDLVSDEWEYLEALKVVSLEDARIIQTIERTGYGKHKRTNHDVKACELYLRDKFEETTLADLVEWIHFGLTSMDVDNIAYALMVRDAVHKVLWEVLNDVSGTIRTCALKYAKLPMLARTHGQSASPTTLGKEFNVYSQRLIRQVDALRKYHILVKLNGATGNYNALVAAWGEDVALGENFAFTQRFEAPFREKGLPGLDINLVTTQIEPHDTYAELFGILQRINTILIDFCQDIWHYIGDDWLVQRAVAGEAGSSTMPHKVNPIDFENAEGNLGIANTLLEYFSRKLPISRLQRDLSDSTVMRNFGVAFGHSLTAYRSILRGMDKISPNEEKILAVLDEHPEVIAEAYQTILRAIGYRQGYDALNALTRGKKVTLEDLHEFVRSLNIPDEVKGRMLGITPRNYIGIAPHLAVVAQ